MSSHVKAVCKYAEPFKLLPTGLPTPELMQPRQCVSEIDRRYVLQNLKQYLNLLCERAGLRHAPSQAFERWRFVEATRSTGPDPVIPSPVDGINGLVQELEKLGLPTEKGKQICRDLASACRADAKKVGVDGGLEIHATETKVWIEKGEMWTVHYSDGDGVRNQLVIKDSIGRHLQEICTFDFPHALFQLLHRYQMIEGIGYQMALPTDMFKCVSDDFGVHHECFASPLNHYFTSYTSAFPDVDIPFGSKGSFFDFYPQEGSFEVNPPFIEEILAATVARILALLARAEEAKKPMSFILFTSAWDDTPAILWASDSPFCRKQSRMMKGKHYYKRGDQHIQRKPYMRAGADSFVFFLQTSEGAKKWTITERKLRRFYRAWE